jgi:hypothetical protein
MKQQQQRKKLEEFATHEIEWADDAVRDSAHTIPSNRQTSEARMTPPR